jgi:hypothetical protein
MAAFVTPQCGVVQVNLAERARTASVAIAAIVEIAAIVISCLLAVCTNRASTGSRSPIRESKRVQL